MNRNLSDRQLNTLKANMGYLSGMGMWELRTESAVDSEWRGLLSDVLIGITQELANTDIIIAPSEKQARDIVAQLNQVEFEEWKAAVRNGVEKGDWTDLIEHARLKKPLQPNK